MASAASTAAFVYRSSPSSRPASANAAIANPFQAASALSSRAGCTRRSRFSSKPALEAARDLSSAASSRRGASDGVGQHLADLLRAPGERRTLFAFRVGVLARSERAIVTTKLAQHVVEDADGDLPKSNGIVPSERLTSMEV